MSVVRLSAARISEHLALEAADVKRLVRALRRVVLDAAPGVAEGIRFNCLCYYDPGVAFGAIGGNICMIEVRDGAVALSFLHGAELRDGSGKSKRRMLIESSNVQDPRVAALIRGSVASARRRAVYGVRGAGDTNSPPESRWQRRAGRRKLGS
jgi:hypothetical protein